MKIIVLFVLLLTILLSGCVNQQQYVCPDGSVVLDPSLCLTTTTMLTTTVTTTTTTSTTTTTPITLVTTVSKICKPCFDFFAYVQHDDTVLVVKNGESKISINDVIYTQYKKIEILHGCTQFPCEVRIHYVDEVYNTSHTDTATLS